jgi:PAS domain S-box-containing protein
MEFISPQIDLKIFWAKMSYIGITTIAPFLFLFIISYIRNEKQIKNMYVILLMILPIIITFLAFTNEWNSLIWENINLIFTSGLVVSVYEHGLAVWINLFYAYSLLSLGIILLIYRFFNSPKIHRLQLIIILIAIAFPFIFNIIYLFELSMNPVDLTPLAFAITGLLVAVGVFKFQLLDILPVAYSKLFKNMNNGFLIFDENDHLLEINLAAQKMFKTDSKSIGKTFEDIFGKWGEFKSFYYNLDSNKEEIILNNPVEKWVEVQRTPLYCNDNKLCGQLIIVTDIDQRKTSEFALKEKERTLETLISNLPGVAYKCRNDSQWTMEFVSDGCMELTGYMPEDLILNNKISFIDIIHQDDRELVWNNIQEALKENKSFELVYRINAADSKEKYVWEQGRGVFSKKGDLLALEGFITDITDTKKAEEKIKKSLEEKNVLLQEIHHRVKNNMQIISSLLSLQSRHIDEEKTLNILNESQGRIKAMAMVHEKLYQSKNFDNINFADYIKSLIIQLESSYHMDTSLIKTNINVEDIYLDINTAIPCGLIINELISNIIKHAFKKGEKGTINANFSRIGNDYILSVKDDGIGLPLNVDIENIDTLGLKLVNALVNQLEGTMEINRNDGTQFIIKF